MFIGGLVFAYTNVNLWLLSFCNECQPRGMPYHANGQQYLGADTLKDVVPGSTRS